VIVTAEILQTAVIDFVHQLFVLFYLNLKQGPHVYMVAGDLRYLYI
jgi:hypothetical protein